MKKIIKTLLALAATSLLAFSCSNELTDSKAMLLANAVKNTTNTELGVSTRSLNPTVNITLKLLGVPSDCTKPGVWAWAKANPDTSYTTEKWPGNFVMTAETINGYSGYSYTLAIDPVYDLGILFNNLTTGKDGKPQTKDIVIPKEDVAADVTYYFNWNSMAYYTSVDDCIGIMGGSITALDKTAGTATITCTTSLLANGDITPQVFDSISSELTVTSAKIKSDVLTIKVANGSGSDVSKAPYEVVYGNKVVHVAVSSDLIESLYANAASAVTDLGLTLTAGDTATFKVWAPAASAVTLLLYDSYANIGTYKAATVTAKACGSCDEVELKGTPVVEQPMTMDSNTGIWTVENVNIDGSVYYKYEITNNDTTYYVADIWNGVAAPDSIASQLVSIDDASAKPANWETSYTNPFRSTGVEPKKYNDAVIYEMHIRDWSRAADSYSTGKFLDVASSSEIMKHLVDLGVTHVQLLPVFDYAQVNADKNYNWGYNPYHYNVPEGRYVTDDYTDGAQAVAELRKLVKTFHDNGIAVIMDVVYNHTSGTLGGSLYDSTVPGYFYRQDASGNYINGSGCGNELATNHKMVKKYVIESLKHWMNDYHINGFRFDLMGCLEADTMKEIYEALYEIDSNVLVYGEPWTGGTSGVVSGATGAGKTTTGYGFGAFDDDYRDAVKGSEFGGLNAGQIQGYFDDNINTGLAGLQITKNNRNATGLTGLALHYAECHDNFTLFDKLVYTLPSNIENSKAKDKSGKIATAWPSEISQTDLELIKKEDKLAAAYLILSQGTPFLNGGQEFMRTKKGNPDSYSADTKGGVTWTSRYNGGTYVAATDIDDVNTINLGFKTTYSDVYNTYKGLITLRKSNDAFTNPSSVSAEKVFDGISKYVVTSTSGKNFTIYFNATENAYTPKNIYKSGEYVGVGIKNVKMTQGDKGKVVTISEVNGSVNYSDEDTIVSTIPAHGFVILEN